MPTDPWDNPTKIYPVGIHSSRVHKPNDVYPLYINGGPDFPFAREYPAYLNKYLIGVHGEQLFHEKEPHWVRNPALPPL